MKQFSTIFICLMGFFMQTLSAQGWIGNGTSLSPNTSAINVGIGLSSPSTQLHTTGGVRFQGLTGTGSRLIQTDLNGVLSAIGAGTTGQVLTQGATGLAWANATSGLALTGNTVATGQWMGSNNAQPVIFKVNNAEAMRISAGGGVSVGYDASNAANTVQNYSNFAAGWANNIGDTDGSVTLGAQNTIVGTSHIGKSVALGWNNNISQSNGYAIGAANVITSEYAGTFGVGLQAGANRAFVIGGTTGGALVNNTAYSLMVGFSSKSTLFVKDQSVGINTITPTANLHSVGTVKLQGLPTGTGRVLVIDAVTGEVKMANATAQFASSLTNTEALMQTIEAQNQLIQDLQDQINDIKQSLMQSGGIQQSLSSEAKLEQNIPNPTNGKTTIAYSLPQTAKRATLMISDMSGKQLQKMELSMPKGNIEVKMESAGIYIYTLISDGKIIDSKKMIVEMY